MPVTPILDNFNRADESPVSQGGNWIGKLGSADWDLQVTTNQLAKAGTNGQFGGAVYNVTITDGEVYATIPTSPTARFRLHVRTQQEGGAAIWDGYTLDITSPTWTIQRTTNNAHTTLGTTVSQALSAGDSVGFWAIGSTVEAWYRPSGGAWTRLAVRSDTTYTSGHIAISTSSTAIRFDDFGGGPAFGPPRRAQRLNAQPPVISNAIYS